MRLGALRIPLYWEYNVIRLPSGGRTQCLAHEGKCGTAARLKREQDLGISPRGG